LNLPPGLTRNPQKFRFPDAPWRGWPGFQPEGGHFAAVSWYYFSFFNVLTKGGE